MRCLLPVFLWLFALPLAAQPAGHPCANVVDSAVRLACYDEAFPLPQEVIEAAVAKAQADFGLGGKEEPLLSLGQSDNQAESDRIESRVIKVDDGRGMERIVTLENGQVWSQTGSRSSGYLQTGDVVQVRKGKLGGYHLVMPNGVSVRVRRTR